MEAQNIEINKNIAPNTHSTSQKDATKKQPRSAYTISTTQSKKVTISKPPTDNKLPNRSEGNALIEKRNLQIKTISSHH